MRQNLGWAIAYNAVALPLAATGFVPPWLAALGMTASSLVVTLNALRLARPSRARWRGAREQTRKFRRSLRASNPAGSRARGLPRSAA
jgi:Cu2+-exporting ATPase